MNYRDEWLQVLNSTSAPANEIQVTWANGNKGIYTMAIFALLKTDPCCKEIMDCETGEILFYR